MGAGLFIGPLYGTIMCGNLGFKLTQDILGIICVIFATLYFVFAGGYQAFTRTFTHHDVKEESQKWHNPIKLDFTRAEIEFTVQTEYMKSRTMA